MEAFGPILVIILGVVEAIIAQIIFHQQRKQEHHTTTSRPDWRYYPTVKHIHDSYYVHIGIYHSGNNRYENHTLGGCIQIDSQENTAKMRDVTHNVASGARKDRRADPNNF